MRIKEVWNIEGICSLIISICLLVIALRFFTSSLPSIGFTIIVWIPVIFLATGDINGRGLRRLEYDEDPKILKNLRRDADTGALLGVVLVIIITILVWVPPPDWVIEQLRWHR